jgi:hypothetical protein
MKAEEIREVLEFVERTHEKRICRMAEASYKQDKKTNLQAAYWRGLSDIVSRAEKPHHKKACMCLACRVSRFVANVGEMTVVE